jgi:hypothetical protein
MCSRVAHNIPPNPRRTTHRRRQVGILGAAIIPLFPLPLLPSPSSPAYPYSPYPTQPCPLSYPTQPSSLPPIPLPSPHLPPLIMGVRGYNPRKNFGICRCTYVRFDAFWTTNLTLGYARFSVRHFRNFMQAKQFDTRKR